MSSLTCNIAISLDGFVAGPNQSVEHPLGEGGERLLQDVGDPVLEPVKVVASPGVTHIKYRVVR